MTKDTSLRSARLCAIVSAALFVSVLIAGSWRSVKEERRTAPESLTASFSRGDKAAEFAADRNALRREELDQLQAIAEDEAASEAVRASANIRIMTLRERMEKEAVIADVLAARGYEAPVVTVQEDSVNVVLRAEALTREEAGIILELVTRETGVTGGNVKIIPIN